jgi:tRNA-5-methyluridine54 2-sulfurtransferase
VKCKRCRGPAVVEVRRHNAAFCSACFVHHVHEQVKRAVKSYEMLEPEDRVLVCVSGGKDSLGLWDVLLELGYPATGMYLGLGIGEYSDRSAEVTRVFAQERGAELISVDLRDEYGFDIPTAGKKGSRSTCAVCGLSKRYVFNRVALDHGFDVVATGHNLDDEAATLFGSVMHWQTEALPRQSPALPSTHPKLVRRVKPLYRLSERETAAYAFLRRIDYIVEECPFAAGATSIAHKEILNRLEDASPGAKHNFLFGFLDRARPAFERAEAVTLNECARCGQVTTGTLCAFCKLADQVKRRV